MVIGVAHNKTSKTLKTGFAGYHWIVSEEVTIRLNGKIYFGDMVIEKDMIRILVEIETDVRRLQNALTKSLAMNSWLWIIGINKSVVLRIRKTLLELGFSEFSPYLAVLTPPCAIKLSSQLH